MKSRRRKAWVPSLVLGIVLLGVWWATTTFGVIDTAFLPTPQSAVGRLIYGLQQGYLATATWVTLQEALGGCAIAAILGIPTGYGIAKSRLFARAVQPYLAAAQAIPAVAIAPLLTIWIGYGKLPIIVLCTIMVVFPVVISSSVGFRHINHDVLGAARLDGASGWTLIRYMELPLAAPGILAGLRTGFTLSITGAVVGEMIIGGNGLGMTLLSSQGSADVKGMFATIILLACCAMAIYGLIAFVEQRANYLIRDARPR
ncbi:ABC transporter permease [Changpingibacter yushuensis]|uniref:ABC transporter permease n=1 Tax=Changpingibacter yushuensis TaxID=2758440 RepID=UPI0015F45F53|nr:ABC transporter permease [Changpingibacter yushuensis]